MGANGVTGENRTLVGWFTASRLNHSATATSGGSRENRTLITGLQDQRSAFELHQHTLTLTTMEPPPGYDPGPAEYKSADLPVNRQGLTRLRGAESGNPTRLVSLED